MTSGTAIVILPLYFQPLVYVECHYYLYNHNLSYMIPLNELSPILFHTFTYWYICVHTHSYVYILVHTYTYWFIRVHTSSCVCILVHTDTYWFMRVHTGSYAYILIHTYTYWLIVQYCIVRYVPLT